ncbi:uncharacterized protein si:dkey-27h10.2 [Solea solea]|uniref:uncharacterized protein si:dkey-27h10.2 n=1 Tax=Solea solea TaxID=90069 RepID=UPI00272973E2|nr:uncharacterized protein si:dkey-27h10.2 [Solea solea]
MSLTCCFFFIPGLVVAAVMADVTTTNTGLITIKEDTIFSSDNNNLSSVEASTNTTNTNITSTINPNITSTTSMTNSINSPGISNTTSNINSVTMSPTIKQRGGETTGRGRAAQQPTKSFTTPKPSVHRRTPAKTTTAAPQTEGDTVGIVIFIVIILMAVGFGTACYFLRKRGKSYSVDILSRQDDVNIPLSTVEPELPADTVPQNGLQTFGSRDTATEESQHTTQEEKPDGQEEQKPEGEKSVDPRPESAAQFPSPDSSEDKAKEDVVEQSLLAPVQRTMDEKTNDEGDVSNQTSVESLKETNENNSNNADVSLWRDLKSSSIFWNIPLDCPV